MNAPLLQTRGLGVRFGGLVAVAGVDFEIARGELVGIIGPNGAGKTTFFNAISGIVQPSSGSLLIAGREVVRALPHVFARLGIARTFQTPRVFAAMSVADNVRFGTAFAGRHRRAKSGLADVAEILDFIGLTQVAERPAGDVIPAQQRRLEIGMALATSPEVLLLDEVAAGLTEAEVEAMALLIRAARERFGLGVAWVEHAVAILLRHVDRVMVLHQGAKLAEGAPAAIARNPAVIEAYLGDSIAPQTGTAG